MRKPETFHLACLLFAALGLALPVQMATAGEVEIVAARATMTKAGTASSTYAFAVTLRHADTGWEHYANKWDVVAPAGELLGTRVLVHPHVDEQPFTRSLSGIDVPAGIDHVRIRAYDTVHGISKQIFRVDLTAR